MLPFDVVKIIFEYSDSLKNAHSVYAEEIEPNELVLVNYMKKTYGNGNIIMPKFINTKHNTKHNTFMIKRAICDLLKGCMVDMQYEYEYKIVMSFINYTSLECYNIRLSGGKLSQCRFCKTQFDPDIIKHGHHRCPKCRKLNCHTLPAMYYIKLLPQLTLDQLDAVL
jgi:hypothetical protein